MIKPTRNRYSPAAADSLYRWFDQARKLGIYVQYTLEGEGGDVLEADKHLTELMDKLLSGAVTACRTLPPGERWLTLHMNQGPGGVLLELSAPGTGPDPPPSETVGLRRYDDSYELRLEITDEQRGRYYDEQVSLSE